MKICVIHCRNPTGLKLNYAKQMFLHQVGGEFLWSRQ